MEELLYESKGTPEKKQRMFKTCSGMMFACAVSLLLLSSQLYGDGQVMLVLIGLIALVAGIGMLMALEAASSNDEVQLAIYTEHMELYDYGTKQTVSLKWDEILNAEKTSMFSNDMLFIKTSRTTYTTVVNDLDKAYRIIDAKLSEMERL